MTRNTPAEPHRAVAHDPFNASRGAGTGDESAPRRRVLVLTRELVAASLLGALVEEAGFAPLFPVRREAAEAALRRLIPDLVLLDALHPAACSTRLYGAAVEAGVRVLVFSPGAAWDDLVRVAAGYDGVDFVSPAAGDTLADCLLRALVSP